MEAIDVNVVRDLKTVFYGFLGILLRKSLQRLIHYVLICEIFHKIVKILSHQFSHSLLHISLPNLLPNHEVNRLSCRPFLTIWKLLFARKRRHDTFALHHSASVF